MVNFICVPEFQKDKGKFDRTPFKSTIIKLINKIILNPTVGKPMSRERGGSREVYMKSFRLTYSYSEKENMVIFLSIYHKDKQ